MRLPVTITSDLICPWCYIGEQNLVVAVARLPASAQVQVCCRPFALNPDMPAEGRDRKEYRSTKFGSWARSQALDRQVEQADQHVGLTFNYDSVTRTPNTTLAHRLKRLASDSGGDPPALAARFFEAYFTDGSDLSDPLVLRAIALEVGLPMTRIEAALHCDLGLAEVELLMQQAYSAGITSVSYSETGRESLSGAQSPDVFEATLRHAAAVQAAAA